MLSTRVGYSGGTKLRPSYHDLGDHTEAIEVRYDPARITYEKLLDLFWTLHDPASGSPKRQYRSAIFPHDAAQEAAAEASKRRREAERGRPLPTAIEPATAFTPAEDYHQKWYMQRSRELTRELSSLVGGEQVLFDSTLGARLNAYFANAAELSAVQKELARLAIPAPDAEKMLESVRAAAGDK